MTALTLCSSLLGLVIYPIVIRRLGMEQYGVYAFILAVVAYFQVVVEWGVTMPAAKTVANNRDNLPVLSEAFSAITILRTGLLLLALAVGCGLVWAIPLLRTQRWLFGVLLSQCVVPILFPDWYFQGMQKMKVVTLINLFFRLLQLPLILIFVHTPDDLLRYAVIVSVTMLLGALVAFGYVLRDGVRLQRVGIAGLRYWLREGTPFFLTTLTGIAKEKILVHWIGIFFGMSEVALYDLATKVVHIPRMFTQSINTALFPRLVNRPTPDNIRRTLHYERIIGVAMMLFVGVVGYPLILLLGGTEMTSAYPAAVILSGSIYTWLVVGAYLQFVFVPRHLYRFVLYNQVVALLSCLLFCAVGQALLPSLYTFAAALALSGGMEILFCRIIIRKQRLL